MSTGEQQGMTKKDVFDEVSKIISVLNEHMDHEPCIHDIRTIIGEIFDQ